MKKQAWFATWVALILPLSVAQAGVVYDDPDGGWSYLFTGEDADGDDFAALDGTWDHDNGSDAWDSSAIGEAGSAPGGVSALAEDGVNFVRFQDVGDPRDDGFADPSNRKIYVTHDITDDDPDGELLLTGVTLTFRTRLATSGLLDGTVPVSGDGYYIRDGGKGGFGIRSPFARNGEGAVVSFVLSTDNGDDEAINSPGGLLMNNLDPAGGTDVDTQGAGDHNELALANPTAWNEFWITIREGDDINLFNVDIYANGATSPESFVVSGGAGNDGSFGSYLGMGPHSTPQSGVFDVDFFGFKPGIHLPTAIGGLPGDYNKDGAVDVADIDLQAVAMTTPTENLDIFDENNDGVVNGDDRVIWVADRAKTWFGDANFDGSFTTDDLVTVFAAGKYETQQMAVWAEGDWTGDMVFDSGDLVAAFADGGFELGPRPAVSAVPEPSSLALLVLGLLAVVRRRR